MCLTIWRLNRGMFKLVDATQACISHSQGLCMARLLATMREELLEWQLLHTV